MDERQHIPTLKWNDWRSQMRHVINTLEELRRWIDVSDEEVQAIEACRGRYRWQVTPYFASLMDPHDPACPIRRQALPALDELKSFPGASPDPVGDMQHRKTSRVIHKYPDRVIILASNTCALYCRHCTRKYHTTDLNGTYYGTGQDWEDDFRYIEQTPQIRDVLLTGGDPLTMSDAALERIIARLRRIPHVEIIRIGSRFPALLPMRITPALCRMLQKYHPIWFSTQFNHPRELTPAAAAACDMLLRSGIPVQNQSVLLKGINDDLETMRHLLTGLMQMRVRPYYLYHCDNASGVSHFATPLAQGLEIMEGLYGFTSGLAIPEYILTTPLGKISLAREKFYYQNGAVWVVNYAGERMDVSHLLPNLD